MESTEPVESLSQTIKELYPKFFVTEMTDDNLSFKPENDEGYIEYKRTLVGCDSVKIEQYATQMKWRISQNRKQRAVYYIGLDDNGKISGLSKQDIIDSLCLFVKITNVIDAAIFGIRLIYIGQHTVVKIGVQIKKLKDEFYIGEEYEEFI